MRFLLLTMLCLSLSAHARAEEKLGNEGANGGDEVALEFKQAFSSAVGRAKERSSYLYEMIMAAKLPAIFESSLILVTNEPLTVKRDGFYQESVAVNHPKAGTIFLNRHRWKELRNEIKEALALHEIAGLVGVESTGQYSISALYLGLFSLDVDPAFDFTPACGRLETQILRRAEELLQWGSGTILETQQAALNLQVKLFSCQRISIQQFCEVVPPIEEFVLSELKQAVEQKMRGEFEYLRAVWARDANKRRCAILRREE